MQPLGHATSKQYIKSMHTSYIGVITLFALSVCVPVCLCPINVKMGKPIRPQLHREGSKFCLEKVTILSFMKINMKIL